MPAETQDGDTSSEPSSGSCKQGGVAEGNFWFQVSPALVTPHRLGQRQDCCFRKNNRPPVAVPPVAARRGAATAGRHRCAAAQSRAGGRLGAIK